MKSEYKISGMSCNGCRSYVQTALLTVDGVNGVNIDIENGIAEVQMECHIDLEKFKQALKDDRYDIHSLHDEVVIEPKVLPNNYSGDYFCPMRCEGSKVYDQPGDCPVCGMDLVPMVAHATKEEASYIKLKKKMWIATAFTLPIFVIAMSEMIRMNPLDEIMPRLYWNWLQFSLSIPVVFYATWMFFQRAYSSIVRRNLNMFTLIGIGAGVAWGFSVIGLIVPNIFPEQFKGDDGSVHIYFEAATVILTLVLLGQLLESRAHSQTNSAVKELLNLVPNTAHKISGDKEIEIPIEQIIVGDLLRVKPGGKIPVDGRIVSGESTIDESMISGEPIPVDKSENDEVKAGTINGNQSFVLCAEKVGSETLLSQIIHLVNNASRSKAPIQKLADKISVYFVPIVIVVSGLTFAAWALFGPEPSFVYAFINAIGVLIIACPCALGLATPMSVMVGVGKGAQLGVLIKDAESLDKMNKIDVLVIDKTGTVTEGRPSVEKIVGNDQYSVQELTSIVASLNQLSEHPLAKATVNYARDNGGSIKGVSNFEAITGKGVKGSIEGAEVFVGNFKLLQDYDVEISPKLLDLGKKEQLQGKTVPFIAINSKLVGFVTISDAIKKTSRSAIDKLKKKNIEIIMMTGDNQYTAGMVAEEIGIENYFYDCLPEEKLNQVQALKNAGKTVAMVGDGINDAPALALSDVGIAMGTGTDIAIETSDITLVKGDLNGIIRARNLSEKVLQNIRQNLFFALGYNVLGVPIAAGVLYPFFGILLSPMIAALAMSFSSVSVISNALRLRSITIK